MICIARIAVFKVYYSATGETVFGEDVMHDAVISMGVDADDSYALCADVLEGPVKHCFGCIAARSGRGDAMDHIIWFLIWPCAFYV